MSSSTWKPSAKRFSSAPALLAAGLLAGCALGGLPSPPETPSEPSATWPGPPQTPSGELDVAAFNVFLERSARVAAREPKALAVLFLRLGLTHDPKPSITEQRDGNLSTVTVLLDGLEDDSVRSQRYVLRFRRQGDRTWRLASGTRTQRCRPGRGHEDFSPELCV